jgi:hypothetical protein
MRARISMILYLAIGSSLALTLAQPSGSPTSHEDLVKFLLTLAGISNFNSDAVVNWNGSAMTHTTYVSGKQLIVAIPASDIASSGTIKVTVTNPAVAGTGPYGDGTMAETSTPVTFTVH